MITHRNQLNAQTADQVIPVIMCQIGKMATVMILAFLNALIAVIIQVRTRQKKE